MNSRVRGVVILVVTAALAVVAAWAINGVIQSSRQQRVAPPPVQKETTIVAADDIPPGRTISADDLRERQLASEHIPDDVFRTAEEVVGRVASDRILAGEFIREERLAAPEAGVGLPAIIPRGMRALQVPIRGSAAVSGFVNPGNFVDVIAVCSDTEPPEVRTLLQAVSVLAVNDRMVAVEYGDTQRTEYGGAAPSVTLALSPRDAELVKHAFGTCVISLTLRNDIDVTGASSNDRPAPAPAAPAENAQGRATPLTPPFRAAQSRG